MEDGRIQDKLDSVKKKLYLRDGFRGNERRSGFSHEKPVAATAWQADDSMTKKPVSFLKLLLLVSMVFFLGACGVAAFLFISGTNVVSSDNIDIEIRGPVAVKAGEEVSLQISIANRNTVPLDFARLEITYPPGTRDPNNLRENLDRYQEQLDRMEPGQVVKRSVQAVLFGEAESIQEIKVTLEYRTENSNSIFIKDKLYPVTITSAPLSVTVTLPKEASSGQQIEAVMNISSNSSETLEDVFLAVTFPSGFTIERSEPSPSFGSSLWSLGDIAAGVSKKVSIEGTLSGGLNESKAFTALVGVKGEPTDRTVTIPYASKVEELAIRRPQVELGLTLGNTSSQLIPTNAGSRIRGDVVFKNNTSGSIRNGTVSLRFVGSVLDSSRMDVNQGFYRSSDKTILWKAQDVRELLDLGPGEEGHVSFNMATLVASSPVYRTLTNPGLEIEVIYEGERVGEGSGSLPVELKIERVLAVATQATLAAQTFHHEGPIANGGAMPPQVNQSTTYTIRLAVANTTSNIENGVVKATLPAYVEFTGQKSPQTESLEFNKNTGIMTWAVGTVPAGSGSSRPPKEVYFQIEFEPGATQGGNVPELLEDIVFTGKDSFAGIEITDGADSVTTLLSDSGASETDATVRD